MRGRDAKLIWTTDGVDGGGVRASASRGGKSRFTAPEAAQPGTSGALALERMQKDAERTQICVDVGYVADGHLNLVSKSQWNGAVT